MLQILYENRDISLFESGIKHHKPNQTYVLASYFICTEGEKYLECSYINKFEYNFTYHGCQQELHAMLYM
jgi:hypothetical protein